jgi:transposase-like protein
VLSVLSGEKPVTAAIAELGISRPLYYQLESKALIAMLTALAPGASASTSPNEATPAHRVAALEQKVSELEQDKRRLERLLFLTRKVLPPGPVTMPGKRGRPRRDSLAAGPGPVLGIAPKTLRRWLTRLSNGESLRLRRGGTRAKVPIEVASRVRAHYDR